MIEDDGATLRAVADLVDEDPWRHRLREATCRPDGEAILEALAVDHGASSQPPSYQVLLALKLAGVGKVEAAERLLRQAQQGHPADANINLTLGSLLRLKGPLDSGEALGFLRAAVALLPRSPAANNNLGSALNSQGKSAEAEIAFRKAIALKPNHHRALCNLGYLLQQQRRFIDAEAAYREAISAKPDYAEAHNGLGAVLNDGPHRHKDAEASFREAIRLNSKYAEAYNNLGIALMDQRRVDDAIEAYRKATQLKRHYTEAHINLGHALMAKRLTNEAIAEFETAISINKHDPVAHNNYGDALMRNGQLDEAIIEFQRAIELKKDHVSPHNNLGNAWVAKGRLDDAIAEYRKAIDLDGDAPDPYCNLGIILTRKGRYKAAIDVYSDAMKRIPNNAKIRNAVAWLLATCPDKKFRDPARAVELAQLAVNGSRNNGDYWSTLGTAMYRNGDWKGAIQSLSEAMPLRSGGDSFDFFFLAMAHWQSGEQEKARAWHEKAVAWMEKNAPKDEELRRFRAEAAALMAIKD